MPSRLQAVFWDVDGTLAETEMDGHRPAFNAAFAEAGLPWRWDPATYLELLSVSGGRERFHAFLEAREGAPPAPERLEALVRSKQRHYGELLRRGEVPLRPGVARLIKAAAAAGLEQMIVTTSSRPAVEALVAGSLAPLAGAFSGWICGEDVTRKKPDPEAYRLALAQAGVEAGNALVVEDSANGLAAARGAGLTTLITLSSLSRHEGIARLEGAAAVVDGLGEAEQPPTVLRGPDAPAEAMGLAWLESLLPPI